MLLKTKPKPKSAIVNQIPAYFLIRRPQFNGGGQSAGPIARHVHHDGGQNDHKYRDPWTPWISVAQSSFLRFCPGHRGSLSDRRFAHRFRPEAPLRMLPPSPTGRTHPIGAYTCYRPLPVSGETLAYTETVCSWKRKKNVFGDVNSLISKTTCVIWKITIFF